MLANIVMIFAIIALLKVTDPEDLWHLLLVAALFCTSGLLYGKVTHRHFVARLPHKPWAFLAYCCCALALLLGLYIALELGSR